MSPVCSFNDPPLCMGEPANRWVIYKIQTVFSIDPASMVIHCKGTHPLSTSCLKSIDLLNEQCVVLVAAWLFCTNEMRSSKVGEEREIYKT